MSSNCDDKKTAAPPVFILDGSLGDVAKFLRIMGFSAELRVTDLMREKIGSDHIVVTRSEELANHLRKNGKKAIILPKRKSKEGIIHDLRVLVEKVSLGRMRPHMFCTPFCQRCNSALLVRDARELSSLIPEKSLHHLDWAYYCTSCNTAYWLGSHWKRIRDVLERALEGYDIVIPRPWQKSPPCQ